MSNQNRQPAGAPAKTGGQFASGTHDETSAALVVAGRNSHPLAPRGFISVQDIDRIERGLEEARMGDFSVGYAQAMEALGVSDPNDECFLAISAAYDDDAVMDEDEFPAWQFRDDVRSLVGAYHGWDESIYGEPDFGSRAEEVSGKTTTEVNKMLRREFRDAQRSGYLPESFKVNVTEGSTGEPRVEYSGVPDEFRLRDYYPDENYITAPERIRETPEFQELDRRIRAVANTFATDKTDHYSHDPIFITKNKPIVQLR